MKTLRVLLTAGALALACVAATPATAHRLDRMTPNRGGPIRRGETTMTQMRRWFGPPSARRVVQVGCVRVVRARWGDDLRVYASRGETRVVEAVFVRARRLVSSRHGELRMHTGKGLRVGDRERKLRRLYPPKRGITHAGHTHYRLRTARHGSYMMAKVVDHRVVQLEAWPFEFC
ncbi:MAG: hypothetical protein ACRDJ5_11145 [Actinomycetota bacterium]